MAASKRASSQPAGVAFDPVYQSSEGGIKAAAAAAEGEEEEREGAADSVGTATNDAAARATRSRGKQGKEGSVRDGAVASAMTAEDGGGAGDGKYSEEDDDDDDDVDWEEQDMDGGGVLGAEGQVVVDSDGDEGASASNDCGGCRRCLCVVRVVRAMALLRRPTYLLRSQVRCHLACSPNTEPPLISSTRDGVMSGVSSRTSASRAPSLERRFHLRFPRTTHIDTRNQHYATTFHATRANSLASLRCISTTNEWGGSRDRGYRCREWEGSAGFAWRGRR